MLHNEATPLWVRFANRANGYHCNHGEGAKIQMVVSSVFPYSASIDFFDNSSNNYVIHIYTWSIELLWLIVATGIIEIAAQVCAKKSYITNDKRYMLTTFLLYGIISLLLIRTYKYSTMGLVNAMWNAFTTISIVVIGMCVYGEKINGWGISGIALTLVGFYLIYVKGHPFNESPVLVHR